MLIQILKKKKVLIVVYDWLSFVIVATYRIVYKRDLLNLIWFSTVWITWKERKARIFKNKDDTIHHLLVKIKAHSYRWLKAKDINFAFSYHMW